MNKYDLRNLVFQPLLDKGFSVFFVGGCVRDTLMGTEPHDFDITTNATPVQLHAIFSKFSGKSNRAEQFGVTIPLINNQEIEIATFRSDGFGRHPSIVYANSIAEDCVRRDFPINALYEDVYGNIFDPTGQGKKDIQSRCLRFMGNPIDRLIEDPLRAFRYVRFLSQKGLLPTYSVDELEEFATHICFDEVSKERQLQELKLIFSGKYFTMPYTWEAFFSLQIATAAGIEKLKQDMLQVPQSYKWHSEGSVWTKNSKTLQFEDFNLTWDVAGPVDLKPLYGWVPIKHGTVWDHTKQVVEATVQLIWHDTPVIYDTQTRFELVLAAFLHDIGKCHPAVYEIKHHEYTLFEGTDAELFVTEDVPKVHDHPETGVPHAVDFCKQLNLTKSEIKLITTIIAQHMEIHSLLKTHSLYKKRVLLNNPYFKELALIGRADDIGSSNLLPNDRDAMSVILKDPGIQALQALGPLEPAIVTGRDLIREGYAVGPAFSKALDAAYKTQINENISDKNVLLNVAKKILKDYKTQ